jgi:hypothetical protein
MYKLKNLAYFPLALGYRDSAHTERKAHVLEHIHMRE